MSFHFIKAKCSPAREKIDSSSLSCYTDLELCKILNSVGLQATKSRQKNIEILRKYFDHCLDEICWLDKSKVKDINKSKIFRPFREWKNDGWLSNDEIDRVLRQYEDVYDDFAYLGYKSLDFIKVGDFSGPNFNSLLKRGKKRFALIIYLYGKTNKFRRHWTSIFIDASQGRIDYFDSSLFKIQEEIWKILMRISIVLKKTLNFKKILIVYNSVQVQTVDGSCGIFAIDFIIARLSGMKYTDYLNNINESAIEKKRDIYFNKRQPQ